MTPRLDVIAALMALPTDEARVEAYLEIHAREEEALNAERAHLIIMCSCSDYMACEHGYPAYLNSVMAEPTERIGRA